jgi:transcriptional regulator with XRE-family HTH domain
MLALPSSSEAGKCLRDKRERLHLSIRQVEKISQLIAAEKKNRAFYVRRNWISELENGKCKPRLEKFHSLSVIYDCDIGEVLALFGLKLPEIGKERASMVLPHTHLVRPPLVPLDSVSVPFRVTTTWKQTSLILSAPTRMREMTNFLAARQAGTPDLLYGCIGTDDYTLDPIIRPGAFVQIDPHQRKIIHQVWPNEYERPVYFVELRDCCYACSWCELEDNYLLLIPSPRSPVSIRRLRYRHDAEIIGRVVGFVQRLGDIPRERRP